MDRRVRGRGRNLGGNAGRRVPVGHRTDCTIPVPEVCVKFPSYAPPRQTVGPNPKLARDDSTNATAAAGGLGRTRCALRLNGALVFRRAHGGSRVLVCSVLDVGMLEEMRRISPFPASTYRLCMAMAVSATLPYLHRSRDEGRGPSSSCPHRARPLNGEPVSQELVQRSRHPSLPIERSGPVDDSMKCTRRGWAWLGR